VDSLIYPWLSVPEDTVDLVIWSGVEMAVTLICVGIPTLRPLYRVIVHGSSVKSSESRYIKHDDSSHSSRFRMQNPTKRSTMFSVAQESITEAYIARNNQSDEEILMGQYGNNIGGIRVREEVRVQRI
jgi:hypothetical protein